MSRDFLTHLKLSSDEKGQVDVKFEENQADVEEEEEVEEDAEEEEEEEFSFMCGGANTSPIAAEDAFINGQIKPVFPLFSRDLLFYGEDPTALHDNLAMRPPVKVFVETAGGATSSAAGPSCDWSDRKAVEASPEVCKKSNSTGFSKIWRFKDLLGRSNSDGRDAFVFLNNSHAKGEEKKEEAVKVSGKSKKGGKVKTAPLSAHEVYLKSKAKGEERRRSYLPYRPELMGFFTNVNGGLSKNVHPF
ncbi:uncharacterized protein LOC125206396 [Salvia hispanica]|uniref:uncharacterized protein LOC125206396 n=1 Tax=Salvia hispanica TaxID=49212 RepID=UPI00200979D1|nr:uncharacterized protein LOC125206396 [Salvia hispanica]